MTPPDDQPKLRRFASPFADGGVLPGGLGVSLLGHGAWIAFVLWVWQPTAPANYEPRQDRGSRVVHVVAPPLVRGEEPEPEPEPEPEQLAEPEPEPEPEQIAKAEPPQPPAPKVPPKAKKAAKARRAAKQRRGNPSKTDAPAAAPQTAKAPTPDAPPSSAPRALAPPAKDGVGAQTASAAKPGAEGGGGGAALGSADGASKGQLDGDATGTAEVDLKTLQKTWLKKLQRKVNKGKRVPKAARLAGLEGKVVVAFVIGMGGEVQTVRLAKSSGHDLLDKAALTSAKKLTRLPAPPTELGWTGTKTIKVPYRFKRARS